MTHTARTATVQHSTGLTCEKNGVSHNISKCISKQVQAVKILGVVHFIVYWRRGERGEWRVEKGEGRGERGDGALGNAAYDTSCQRAKTLVTHEAGPQ